MADIHIISASAGSGKTYRLAQEIYQDVASGRVRPEGIIATTFTNKAAAELQERVRRLLLSKGLVEEAQRLAAARMGTVNSVCGSILKDFAFDLGLFPDITILDEEQSRLQLGRSLDATLTVETQKELAGLKRRFVEFDWMGAVRNLVEAARSNGLGPEDLADCRVRSVDACLSHFGDRVKDKKTLESQLEDALQSFLNNVDQDADTTKTTDKTVSIAGQLLNTMQGGQDLTWANWVKLSTLRAGKKSDDLLNQVRAAGHAHDNHPGLRHDMRRAIELVFDLAIQGLEDYQEYKRQRGAMDFADQESLALDLLNRPKVIDRLSQESDLLLVDEFQDTSPIQLAIFLKLAEACGRAVWVGDQKQSIYAFRGTDSALMDACLKAMTKKIGNVETLNRSWRSRPFLVRLTSEVFSRAFSAYGIREDLVRLEPAHDDDDPDLGPVLERWVLGSGDRRQSKDTQASAVAAGVAELLADKTVRVRDQTTKATRQARAQDVGILCRNNDVCQLVTDYLVCHGIQAQIARPGLMSTPEGLVVLAGLKLWVDPKDALAASEIARLIHYSDQPDKWLSALLQSKSAECFFSLPEMADLQRLSNENPTSGPVTALDMVLEATGVRDYCHAWGKTEARLANLEALRGHCHVYANSASAEGAGVTTAGLVDYLADLQSEGADSQGLDPGRDAVTVSTWHAAKGLEWPITVLHQLDKTYEARIDGVVVMGREDGFDVSAPLADRWVRYWPYPYGRNKNNIPFRDRILSSENYLYRNEREKQQELRLLYVGWTRARDRLILAGPPSKFGNGLLALLSEQAQPLLNEPRDGAVNWAGIKLDCVIRELEPALPSEVKDSPGSDYQVSGPREYPPAFVSPSSAEGLGVVVEEIELGPRMTLAGQAEPLELGEVLHTFLAADRTTWDRNERLTLARQVLDRWHIPQALKPEEMVAANDALHAWLGQRWPGAVMHPEWPIFHRLPGGTVMRGFADLVVMTDDGFAVIDHKAFPGDRKQAVEHAQGYAGQLQAYIQAIARATGKRCLGGFIHLPVSGLICGVSAPGNSSNFPKSNSGTDNG